MSHLFFFDLLQQSGITYVRDETDGKVCMFRHQILHDFLVCRHLARIDKEDWQPWIFEVATLEKKSFEALEFSAEFLEGIDADEFLIEVYDWSWQAVFGIMMRLESLQSSSGEFFTPLLTEAFYSTLSEKKFDHFEHTSKNIQERILMFKSKIGIDYKRLENFEELISEVNDKYTPPDCESRHLLEKWKNIFIINDEFSKDYIKYLWDNPLIAWTAANVFRRKAVKDKLFNRLVELYDAISSVCSDCPRSLSTRWRIVHILGRYPEEKNLSFLMKIVFNSKENKNVRFGAVRSLIEATSLINDEQMRADTLKYIACNLNSINEKIVVQELRRTAFFRLQENIPDNWRENYIPILQSCKKYFENDGNEEETKRCLEQIDRLENEGKVVPE